MNDARLRSMAAMVVLALVACGREAPVDAASSATRPAAPANDYTTAVPVGSTSAAAGAGIEFKLGGKPTQGTPLTLSLKVTAKSDLARLDLALVTDEGLALAPTQEAQLVLGAVAPSQPQLRDVLLVPARDGVYLLRVTLTTEATGQAAQSSEFAVPVMVVSEAPAAAAPAAAG